ncbi:tetratricopeptide repeat protein [Nitrosomonas sp. Nm34]|uniref:YfgM family protein n=1 Tax=Nitrosomonas sp. Nm34 TaxID=1881055 RepID=UPI0008F296DD|nr:tetratricopeptide repeat protein [Nitrosomonas sp. Nm34]SFI25453.1 Putative negative regulator of RcsB-dependent stress response [Nitrosomonas sp. Nm34]
MAAYNPEEQEKIEGLKAWWAAHGNTVIIMMTAFIAAIVGTQAWNYYHKQQAQQSADLFAVLQQQIEQGSDPAKINDAAHLLTEGFPTSGYASRAALIAAQANADAGNQQAAKNKLQWVLDRSKEPELKDIARLRLAGILLDEKKYEEALNLLNAQHGEPFSGLYADLKGDILAASGKIAEARIAYQQGIDKLSGGRSAYQNIVQMKLDALRESKQ